MPDEIAPSASPAAASAPAGSDAAVAGVSQSADTGNAPGAGADGVAGGGDLAQGQPSAPQTGQYLFRGRTFRDQKHAEEVFGGEVDRVRGVQRQNADLQKQLEAASAELTALRGLLSQGQVPGRMQGAPQAPQNDGVPQSFADKLAKSGDLQFITQLAEEKGIGHAIYELARLMDQHTQEQINGFRDREIAPFIQNYEIQQGVSQLMGSVKQILPEFPELEADPEQNPEAAEAQQYVLERVKAFPPEWLTQNGAAAVRMAILEYRHQNGTPTFANPPGSSGSPSSFALAAAEKGGVTPLNGSGLPPQRPGNAPETSQERMKRENREINAKTLRTPSGRVLWTPVA